MPVAYATGAHRQFAVHLQRPELAAPYAPMRPDVWRRESCARRLTIITVTTTTTVVVYTVTNLQVLLIKACPGISESAFSYLADHPSTSLRVIGIAPPRGDRPANAFLAQLAQVRILIIYIYYSILCHKYIQYIYIILIM
jgi:hypothetical protein